MSRKPVVPCVGDGLVVRRVVMRARDVVFFKGIVEASDGLAAVFAEHGGDLVVAAPASRVRTKGHPSESMGKNLDLGFEFVIVAEVNNVVVAVVATPLTTKALGMDRKQKRCLANRHERIINGGFDRFQRETGRYVAGLHLDSQDTGRFRIHPYGTSVSRSQRL